MAENRAPKLLAFAGSLRKESLNERALAAAVPMARAAAVKKMTAARRLL